MAIVACGSSCFWQSSKTWGYCVWVWYYYCPPCHFWCKNSARISFGLVVDAVSFPFQCSCVSVLWVHCVCACPIVCLVSRFGVFKIHRVLLKAEILHSIANCSRSQQFGAYYSQCAYNECLHSETIVVPGQWEQGWVLALKLWPERHTHTFTAKIHKTMVFMFNGRYLVCARYFPAWFPFQTQRCACLWCECVLHAVL